MSNKLFMWVSLYVFSTSVELNQNLILPSPNSYSESMNRILLGLLIIPSICMMVCTIFLGISKV